MESLILADRITKTRNEKKNTKKRKTTGVRKRAARKFFP